MNETRSGQKGESFSEKEDAGSPWDEKGNLELNQAHGSDA